ncbi:MAG TPA: alpha/beta hydrolase [Gemmatimonadaceae bacterium]|nr:alpha/beta hydrolase [Gemmatimonadaceae bacterium]
MARYWMITNRNVEKNGFGKERSNKTTYWTATQTPLTRFSNWTELKGGAPVFAQRLAAVADKFKPLADEAAHADQKHVTLFVHGYNNDWSDAVSRYEQICDTMFSGQKGLGECVLFTWPSNGRASDYLADRADARESANALADVLSQLYDWLLTKQSEAANDSSKACKAKVSLIAHSMGNYLLQKAAQAAWTRKNQPLLVSLINQCLMVAADVDNDLFSSGESTDKSDGDALANLVYRITALYSGLDDVLGVSAGLKHFGKRRLGRSGLDPTSAKPDNVWQVDCTPFFDKDPKHSKPIHSGYFENPRTRELMREVLRGTDRGVLESRGVTRPN